MSITQNRKLTIPLIFLLVVCTFILIGTMLIESKPAVAANVYWVGGSGNWSDNTNHWSASSGGAPGAAKPTSGDTVYFDANSFSGASQVVTLDETAYCFDMDWTGVTNTPTLAGANNIDVSGSLTFDSAMLCTMTGSLNFIGTGGGDTVDFAGLSLAANIVFNGAGGDWTLQDDLTTTGTLTLTNGTLDTNSQDLDTDEFIGDIAGTKTLTLGSSTWTASDNWELSSTTTTLNCGTSTIINTKDSGTFNGGSKIFYNVQLTGHIVYILGTNTYTNLIKTGAAFTDDAILIYANQTVTGTVTFAGNSSTNRLLVRSNTSTERTISAVNTSVSNADFYYIGGSGLGNWDFSANPNGCGWSGGTCTNITFSSPLYYVGGTGTSDFFNGNTRWSYTSGGVYHTNFMPREDIAVVFDSNSPTETINLYESSAQKVKSITFTGSPGAIEFDNSGGVMDIYLYGDFITATNTTFNCNFEVDWRFYNDAIISTHGIDMEDSLVRPIGSYVLTLGSDIYSSETGASFGNSSTGGIITNDYDVYFYTVYASPDIGIDLGASEVYCTYFNAYSGSTVDAGTSTIYTTVFIGGGKTYYDVFIDADIATQINGANTFNNLTIIGAASTGMSLYFTADQTINNDLIISGNNATTYRLLINSNVPGTQRTLYVYHGYALQYCDVQDIQASGPLTPWDCTAGINVDLGNNYDIIFTPSNTFYWVGNAGSYSNKNHWASSSGGTGGTGRVPVGNDTAIFDGYSTPLPSQTIIMDMSTVPTIDTTDAENNPTFSATTLYVRGSLLLGDCTFSVTTIYFQGNNNAYWSSTNTLTSAYIIDKDPDGMPYVELSGNITVSNTVTLLAGSFSLDTFNLTANNFVSTTTTDPRALDLGTGTFTLTATGSKWNVAASNLTVVDRPGSTIVFDSDVATACTFVGAGLDWGNFTIMGAGVYSTTISGTNSFNTITIDRSEASKTITGSVTCTILGLEFPLSGTNTVTITNTDFSSATAEVYGDYLIISGSTASGGGMFWANVGGNSTNNGGNSGWIWTLPTDPTVVTLDPSDVSYMGEQLNGQVSNMGDYGTVYAYFEYGPSISYGFETDPMETMTGTGTFDFYLSPYKVYHYRAVLYYGLGFHVYGTDKTISLSGAVGQAEADLSGLDFTEGTPLVDEAPDEPGQMYDEGNTSGIPFADFIQDALDESDIPTEVFWYPVAFFIAIVVGFLVYGYTRSFIMQPISSALVMAAFCGGGTLGDGLLPFWTVLVFAIEATMVFILQERQTA